MRGHPELDEAVNIELVCHKCHMSGVLDTPEHAIDFAFRQLSRGYDVFDWYKFIKLKTRRFPNLSAMLADIDNIL